MMHTKLVILAAVLIVGTYRVGAVDCTQHPMTIMAKNDTNWLAVSVVAPANTSMTFCRGLAG